MKKWWRQSLIRFILLRPGIWLCGIVFYSWAHSALSLGKEPLFIKIPLAIMGPLGVIGLIGLIFLTIKYYKEEQKAR